MCRIGRYLITGRRYERENHLWRSTPTSMYMLVLYAFIDCCCTCVPLYLNADGFPSEWKVLTAEFIRDENYDGTYMYEN